MARDSIDYVHATVAQLVQALLHREVSALELCDAAIARIEERDAAINAVVVRDFERARAQARLADARLASGEHAPLLGVPMTVKEAFDVAGLPTTWGLAPFRDHVATRDAVAVARLKHAGAVILGKTNVPTALGDWQSVNPLYGRTVHPKDAARTPGGSSGGAAAALASGMVALELGSDIGGSIRVPAHFCGVFGHKPTYGLLPQRGHAVPGSDGADRTEIAVIGPLARSADDLATALDVLAGPDEDDAVAYSSRLPSSRVRTLPDARILVLDTHPCAATATSLRAAIARLALDLERAGAKVARESALLPDLERAHHHYTRMLGTVTSRGVPEAKSISAHDWLSLIDEQHRLRVQWQTLFGSFDAVIAPCFGTVAFAHLESSESPHRLFVDGVATPYEDQLAWPGVATFPGLPATAVPIDQDAEGWPIGVQVIGPRLEDRTPIAMAALIANLRA
ncbi:amidase family protein [Deinococcus yavapaiensis]|uniref:amidase family protein n=1 Tax=Deinococcus yavapaiensis TaxID=309889 RepID=UPI001B85F6DF|nr:amidase family protein [Deinococcus yavapaiensis]